MKVHLSKVIFVVTFIVLMTLLVWLPSSSPVPSQRERAIGKHPLPDSAHLNQSVLDQNILEQKLLSQERSMPTVNSERPQHSHSNALLVALTLRWKFDDIIYAFQQNQQPIDKQLSILSYQLQLSESATRSLFDLFSRYKEYTKALANLKQESPDITIDIPQETAAAFIEKSHQLQFTYFDESEIDAFFGHSNQYDQQALHRLAIRQDPTLTPQQKQSLIDNQIQQLSPEEKQVLLPTVQVNQILRYIKGDTQQINHLDNDALSRIQTLQIEHQQWKDKVGRYLTLKKEFANGSITQDKVEHYLDNQFTTNEQRRLVVYEKNPQLLTP